MISVDALLHTHTVAWVLVYSEFPYAENESPISLIHVMFRAFYYDLVHNFWMSKLSSLGKNLELLKRARLAVERGCPVSWVAISSRSKPRNGSKAPFIQLTRHNILRQLFIKSNLSCRFNLPHDLASSWYLTWISLFLAHILKNTAEELLKDRKQHQ